jgi:hypothetical protein
VSIDDKLVERKGLKQVERKGLKKRGNSWLLITLSPSLESINQSNSSKYQN